MNVVSRLAAPSKTLPAPLTSFVGREAEVAELLAIIEKSRLLTLTGAGGCGKTRLALRLATELEARYPDGGWWIELAAVSQPEKVPLAVANGWHLREEPGRPPMQTLAEQLAGRRALLVLDNCEHVLGACAALVEELIGASPSLTILNTSREPLGIAGELVWRVPSLDDEAAALLFVDRAAQIRPGFTPNSSEKDAIAQICRRLDGIPLAIELAAARCRMMNPARIAAGLDDRFRLLTGGVRTSLPRQQTLETSVAWSYNLLDEAERAVLRRLSIFAGGFTMDAAEAVCADDEVDEYAVLDLVSRLVDKSVVQVDHLDEESRYRLLETVRLYARERLLEAGETNATRDRHCEFFIRLAETAEPELAGPEGPRWLGRLEQEHDNLRSALEWADASGNRTRCLRLCTALTLFWELRGHLGEGCRWFARVLQFDDEPSVARARSLWGAAHAALYHDDYQTAMLRAPQALEMGRKLGDDWAMARALNTLGWIQLWFEPDQALEALKQSIELGYRIGDNWAIADGWKMITVAWLVKEEHSGFRDALVELHKVATALENKFFIAWYHCCVGWIATREGDFDVAREALEASLGLCEEVGEPATGGVALAVLGEVESLTGDYDSAEDRLNRFLERAAVTGGAAGVPCALPVLAALALGRGNPSGAREILDPFVDEMRKLGLPLFLSWGLGLLGATLVAQGDIQAAKSILVEAKTTGEILPNRWLMSLADYHLAEVARREDDYALAEELHHEALASRAEAGLKPGAVESLEALAFLAADLESWAEATWLLGATSNVRETLGFVRWPAGTKAYEDTIDRCRTAMGDAAFRETFARGTKLSLEEAISYSSRARGERKRPSTGWQSLTPTELAVSELVADGLTNRQIGEQMFISPATVKTHLAHIFNKLGVTSRSALAAENTRRNK